MKKALQTKFILFILLVNTTVNIQAQVGIGTTNPAASAQLELSSTTRGFLPPRLSFQQRDAMTPVEGLMIYNTDSKKPNYYDGTGWRNFDGSSATNLVIGSVYQGGIVFYILQSGDPGYIFGQTHGFIAAASDQSTSSIWGCYGSDIPGANLTALGTGSQNTIDIITACGAGGVAAKLCGDLQLNGYSDWHLPSKDELNKLYINRAAVGGFAAATYWSSSEFDCCLAWNQLFTDGFQNLSNKNGPIYVRAVRAF